jgi:hypothetical protein
MRAYEFEKPLSIEQSREKSLKQQAKDIQVRLKKERLQKQREKVAVTTQALTKLQSQTL